MRLRLEARGAPSAAMAWATPPAAVLATLVAGSVLFAGLGFDPLQSLYSFFIQPLTNAYGIGELAVKGAPLIICAVGLSIGFRANVWNIGAEGQLTMGAICGGGVALALPDAGWWLLPVMVVAGAAGGMAWAAIPAFLRTRFNANEILTSLMLSYVAVLILSYLVHGPWRDPAGFNFPESAMFPDTGMLPVLWEGTRLHAGVLLAVAVVLAGWLLVSRAFLGFQIAVAGMAPAAAGYAGFRGKRLIWLSLLIGGGLAGLAGLGEVAGPIGQLRPTVSPGYGFTAIIVAFLGRLHPLGIVPAGLLVALSYIGGETVQIELGMPVAVAGVFQGMLLFFLLASDVLVRYRVRLTRPGELVA
ncbi:MAG: ABC transporter permease [Alphaproteobacteria bacterium]